MKNRGVDPLALTVAAVVAGGLYVWSGDGRHSWLVDALVTLMANTAGLMAFLGVRAAGARLEGRHRTSPR
ncbi:hypothetical protein ACJ6WD_39890 [Streptomyces sp. VTCC 41912]|uniref:hypothetical protein n=1 Tax=Streptomyces sp. VTCC 41912 TaxID=3383243 RepID=UPI003896D642